MLKFISATDFQSHKVTALKLNPCFNIITGPSGCGKSALLRALNALFYNNMQGTSFVRIDPVDKPVKYEIEAVSDTNNKVVKTRGENINEYSIIPGKMLEDQHVFNNVVTPTYFQNVRTEVPAEVSAELNIHPVKIDANTKINIQYCGQFDAPFMLMETDSTKMKFLNALSGTYAVDLAIKESNLLLQRNKKVKEAAEKEVNVLSMESKQLGDKISTLEVANKYVADKFIEYNDLQQKLDEYKKFQVKVTELINKFRKIAFLCDLFDKTEFDTVAEKVSVLRRYMELNTKYQTLLQKVKKMNGLLSIVSKVDYDNTLSQIAKLKKLSELQTKYANLVKSYSKNTTLIDEESKNLSTLVDKYATLLEEVKICPICHSKIDNNVIGHIKETLV